jgi:hypothetical protein
MLPPDRKRDATEVIEERATNGNPEDPDHRGGDPE